MFGAVALFVILLLGMLYLAFVRFRNPPQPRGTPAPVGVHAIGAATFAWQSAPLGVSRVAFHPRPGERAHG